VPAKKPAPDIYLSVLGSLGIGAPGCVAFEDSENGLRSSLAAGLATVVTVNDYTRDQDLRGAALVVEHLGEPHAPARALAGALPNGASLIDLAALEALLER